MNRRERRDQQRRDRRAAKPAALLDEPPVALQTAIAEAVHQAVRDVFGAGTPKHGLCFQYNAAGAIVASLLTYHPSDTGPRYAVQAGSLALRSMPRTDPELSVVFDARDDGVVRGEFHVWFIRVPPGAPVGVLHEDTAGQAVFVDLAARFYPVWAAAYGGWEHPPRAYVWARWDDLRSWAQFSVDPAATAAVLTSEGEAERLAVANRALAILADQGAVPSHTTRALESLLQKADEGTRLGRLPGTGWHRTSDGVYIRG